MWSWCRCGQQERAMRPVGVVVVDIDAQDALKLPAAADQEPVEAIAAYRADPAFGERVCLRRPKWGADDLDAFAAEDLIESATELAVGHESGSGPVSLARRVTRLTVGLAGRSSVRPGSRC